MRQSRKCWRTVGVCFLTGLMLAGCGADSTTEEAKSTEDTEAVTELTLPVSVEGYREISEELPAAAEPVENPGTRAHFSFVVRDKTYVFTETETLWLYNQSVISDCDTQFMLNVGGSKVTLAMPEEEELDTLGLEDWAAVYTDGAVTIYRREDTEEVEENEEMYLTLYDLVYRVDYWQTLIEKRAASLSQLYEGLAQMGTAIVPAKEGETLSDVIKGMGAVPVLEDYRMAFRENVPYSAFIFCSPSSGTANHDIVTIWMSVKIPSWQEYVNVHIEGIPDYLDRLEDTGETFDGHPILVDYTGELKYFVIGSDGKCIYLDGMPEETSANSRNYTAREAAYIFEMVLTK